MARRSKRKHGKQRARQAGAAVRAQAGDGAPAGAAAGGRASAGAGGQPGAPAAGADRGLSAAEGRPASVALQIQEVERRLAAGDTRRAFELASALHAGSPSPETEALQIRASFARVDSLMDRGMAQEAEALLEVLESRHPSAAGHCAALRETIRVRSGRIHLLISPLASPDCAPETRERIEALLRDHLADPSILANCEALPRDHALRAAAREVAAAFQQVTRGPVQPEALALPAVSRRSPLAPWKLLVRAIASFYAGKDEECRAALRSIPPRSRPAGLVPVLEALLGDRPALPLTREGELLLREILTDRGRLERALRALDQALEDFDAPDLLGAVREAIHACRQHSPAFYERARIRIAARASTELIAPDRLRKALGGPIPTSAEVYRLHALAHAKSADVAGPLEADWIFECLFWEAYLAAAVREGVFPARSTEAGLVSLRIAERLAQRDPDELREAVLAFQESQRDFLREQSAILQEPQDLAGAARACRNVLDPAHSFARAAALLQDVKAYEAWVAWAGSDRGTPEEAEAAAAAWRAARPKDLAPLLILVELAQKRKAITTALRLVEEAEKIDAVNPRVRLLRIRLWVSAVLRHLRQRKPHLARRDLEQCEAIPAFGDKDLPALLAALRWATACMEQEGRAPAEALSHETARALQDPPATRMLLEAVADIAGLAVGERWAFPGEAGVLRAGVRARAAARVMRVLDEVGASPRALPNHMDLSRDLEASPGASPEDCLVLARAALRLQHRGLAYVASGIGLAGAGALGPRLLLCRARALPGTRRRASNVRAALALAQDAGDTELLRELMDLVHHRRSPLVPRRAVLEGRMDPASARKVLAWEAGRREPRTMHALEVPPDPYFDRAREQCECPSCRRRRAAEAARRRKGWRDEIDPTFGGKTGEETEDALDEFFGDPEADPLKVLLADAFLRSMGIRSTSPPVKEVIGEMIAKYFDPTADRPLPTAQEISRRDPELYERLLATIAEAEFGGRRRPRR